MLQETVSKISLLDYIVIGLYMLGTLGIGFYLKKKSVGSMEDFFLGGRRLPGWANGFSQAAAFLNSDVAPAYIAWTVGTGLFVCWLYISRFGLALMIGGILFALFWRRLNLFTAPEFYGLRFPGKIGSLIHTWVAVRSAFIALVAWSGVGMLGMAKVTGPVFGQGRDDSHHRAGSSALCFYVGLSGRGVHRRLPEFGHGRSGLYFVRLHSL